MAKSINLALLQCEITAKREKMNARIEKLVRDAVKDEPDILILPERWRPIPDLKSIRAAINEERGRDYAFIQNLAEEYSTAFISGAIWESRNIDGKKSPYITSYFFNETGKEIGRQDKIHLYAHEPLLFKPGLELNIFLHKKTNVKFTILICFDVAFYETPRVAVENGSELLISPTLIRQEGLNNWKIYLAARALENRVPVVACNPVGNFFNRHFPGKSKIIQFEDGHESPSKLDIIEAPVDRRSVLMNKIDISFPNKIRKKRIEEQVDMSKIKVHKVGNF